MESIKEFLRTVPLLSGLRDEELDLLARTAEERRFPAGAHIVHMGEPGGSAFILREGAAETRLEKPTGAPVELSKIGAGELFGELALFDGEPRSASVIATRDCVAIEISRELFLHEISQQPDLALKLLSVLAKRLRRAESIVSNFADRIYGDVLPRLEAAVAAQLDSAKTICEQSKERVDSTVEAAKHVLDAAEQRWAGLTRLVSISGALVAVLLTVLAFFGLEQYQDVRKLIAAEVKEVESTREEAINASEEIKRERSYLKVLKETTTVFDKLRRDLQLEVGAGSAPFQDSPGEAARDFSVAYRQLMNTYLSEPTKWEPEILVEALELVAEISEREYVVMNEADWDVVLDAMEHAIKNPPEHWLQRNRLGSLVEVLYRNISADYPEGARSLLEGLERMLVEEKQGREAAAQTALILARLGSKAPSVRSVLTDLQRADSPWQRSEAAVDLIALGEAAGWQTLRTDLAGQFAPGSPQETGDERRKRERAAFVAARRIASSVVNPRPWRHQARYFTVKELERQLSRESFEAHFGPWPEGGAVGIELVSKTILDRLTERPTRTNRFRWQSSCELLCGLGCKQSNGAGGGAYCKQCFDDYAKWYYGRGEEPDRSSESCPELQGASVTAD